MKRTIFAICFLVCFALLSAEWLSTGKGFGDSPNWQELYRAANNSGYSLTVPGVNRELQNGFQLYSLKENTFLKRYKGLPKVPVLREMIAIPKCDSARLTVSVISSQYYENTLIQPEGVWQSQNGMLVEVPFNGYQAVYDSLDGYYPAKNHAVTYSALRAQQLAEVELYPVQYNADSSRVRVISEFQLNFTFYNSDGAYSQNIGIFSAAATGSIRGLTGNGLNASINTAKYVTPQVIYNPDSSATVDYLMLVSNELYNTDTLSALGQLARHRASYNGFVVGVKKRGDINNATNDDYKHYEVIRKWVSALYRVGSAAHTADGKLGYVCLVGDYKLSERGSGLPPSYDYVTDNCEYLTATQLNPATISNEISASDWYYGCVTKNNINQYDDICDLFVGRIPAGDSTELRSYVNKVKSYEPLNSADLNGWRNKIWFMNGDKSTPYFNSTYSAANFGISKVLTEVQGMAAKKVIYTCKGANQLSYLGGLLDSVIFTANGPDSGWVMPELTAIYNRLFNQNPWIVSYLDHGNTDGWINYKYQNGSTEGTPYDNSPVAVHLTNGTLVNGKNRLPMIFSNACLTGFFDVNPAVPASTGSLHDGNYDCFAERMLFDPDGPEHKNGAIAVVANPRVSTSIASELHSGFFKSLLENSCFQTGEFLLGSKLKAEHYYAQQANLYGDPALNIYFDEDLITRPDLSVSLNINDQFALASANLTENQEPVVLKTKFVNIGNSNQLYRRKVKITFDTENNVIYNDFVDFSGSNKMLEVPVTVDQTKPDGCC